MFITISQNVYKSTKNKLFNLSDNHYSSDELAKNRNPIKMILTIR